MPSRGHSSPLGESEGHSRAWLTAGPDRKPVDPPPILQLEVPPHSNHVLQSKARPHLKKLASLTAH